MASFGNAALVTVTVLSLAACGKRGKSEGAAEGTATATAAPQAEEPEKPFVTEAEARREFVTACASCHGTEGKGDGPGAVALNPKPRNYTDKEWQKSVTDEQIKKTIVYGGAAVGKSPIMPAHPELSDKPEMVEALVKIIRAFGQ